MTLPGPLDPFAKSFENEEDQIKILEERNIPENLCLFSSKNEAKESQEGPRMPTVLRIEDLHEAYGTASKEDAIAMANLGAICYQSVKEGLFAQWSTAEDVAKADTWREEGRQSMFETLKSKLASAEGMSVRLLAAETALEEAHSAMESRISGRVAETLDSFRKDYELVKMKEIAAMQQRIAAAEAREEMIEMVKKGNTAMEEKIALLESQVAEQLAANTKSSHAIGKAGEAEVLDMLQNHVCNEFQYSEVKDMAHISHAADFHLWVVASDLSRVKILIDSKKYKRPIQTIEIEKLNSDVDADEEARAGLMISHESNIQTRKQFSIHRTAKNKPVMYITFQDMTTEMKHRVLSWSVRVLQSISLEKNLDEKIKMVEAIDALLVSLEKSIKKIDGAIRIQSRAVDAMKEVRAELLQKVTTFRKGGDVEDGGDSIEHVEDESEEYVGGCVSMLKKTGKRCNRVIVSGSDKCGLHIEKVIKHKNTRNTLVIDE